MKKLLAVFLILSLCHLAMGQTQGTAVRATNGYVAATTGTNRIAFSTTNGVAVGRFESTTNLYFNIETGGYLGANANSGSRLSLNVADGSWFGLNVNNASNLVASIHGGAFAGIFGPELQDGSISVYNGAAGMVSAEASKGFNGVADYGAAYFVNGDFSENFNPDAASGAAIIADASLSKDVTLIARRGSVISVYAPHKTNVLLFANNSIVGGAPPSGYNGAITNTFAMIKPDGGVIGFDTNNFFGDGSGLTNLAASSLVGSDGSLGTNFVLLTAAGNDATATLNDPNLPSASFSNALSLLAANSFALTNGTIYIPPGETINVTTQGLLAASQTVRVFAWGATITNGVSTLSTFLITNADVSLTVWGGHWVANNGRVFGLAGFPTNAVLSLNNLTGYGRVDWIQRDGGVGQGTRLKSAVTININDCFVQGGYDLLLLDPDLDGLNSTITINNSRFISDAGTNAGQFPTAMQAENGNWRVFNSIFEGRNGATTTYGFSAVLNAKIHQWVNNRCFASSTNGGTVEAFHGNTFSAVFSDPPCPSNQMVLTGFNAVTNSLEVWGTNILGVITGNGAGLSNLNQTAGPWLTNYDQRSLALKSLALTGGISSAGSGVLSERFGIGSTASGNLSLTLGQYSVNSGIAGISIGPSNTVVSPEAIAIGGASGVASLGGIALGPGTSVGIGSDFGVAIGDSARVDDGHMNSVAIGTLVTTEQANQILLGTAAYTVSIPGTLSANLSPANLSAYTATNTLAITSTGLTNSTQDTYLLSITAGVTMSLKDGNNTAFLTPLVNTTVPFKPGWRFTAASAAAGVCVIMSK